MPYRENGKKCLFGDVRRRVFKKIVSNENNRRREAEFDAGRFDSELTRSFGIEIDHGLGDAGLSRCLQIQAV